MRVTVDRDELAMATKKAGKLLPGRGSMPILQCFLVVARDGILSVTADDRESGRRVEMEASVQMDGEILVPPALEKIVSGAKAGAITLDADETEVTIEAGNAKATLRLANRRDYPERVEPDDADAVEVPIRDWSRIRAVATAASGDPVRPIMTGVKLEQGVAAATDYYRLAYVDFSDAKKHPEALIPARAIRALDDDVVALHIGERDVKAVVGDGVWWTRQIEGPCPMWRSLLKDEEPTLKVTVDCEELSRAVKRATAAISPVYVTLRPENGELRVLAGRQDLGDFTESVAAKIAGDPAEVNLNPRFLLDVLAQTEEITLGITSDYGPVTYDGGGWWRGLVMPMRA